MRDVLRTWPMFQPETASVPVTQVGRACALFPSLFSSRNLHLGLSWAHRTCRFSQCHPWPLFIRFVTQVCLPWTTFSSSGYKEQPSSVRSAFLIRNNPSNITALKYTGDLPPPGEVCDRSHSPELDAEDQEKVGNTTEQVISPQHGFIWCGLLRALLVVKCLGLLFFECWVLSHTSRKG